MTESDFENALSTDENAQANNEDTVPLSDAAPLDAIPDSSDTTASPPSAPLTVISVDDLLSRLEFSGAGDTASQNGVEDAVGAEVPAVEVIDVVLDILDQLQQDSEYKATVTTLLSSIDEHLNRPALTTSFSDYTITETLLLLILLFHVINACIRIVKGGFNWLMW